MNKRYLFDITAIIILLGYVWLAQRTEVGAADPVWSRAHERGTLIVGMDQGFAPFMFNDANGNLQGYDVDLVTEIARRLDLTIEWRQVGYDALFSAIDPSNPNHVDMLASGIVENPGEAWRARFSIAYFDGGLQLIVPVSSTLQSQNDLAGKTIAVQLGSSGEALAHQMTDVTINNSAETQEQAVELTLSSVADAAIVDNLTALAFIQRDEMRTLASLSYEPYVLVVPATAYQLHSEINRILGDLHKEGWIARLNEKWLK